VIILNPIHEELGDIKLKRHSRNLRAIRARDMTLSLCSLPTVQLGKQHAITIPGTPRQLTVHGAAHRLDR
jgi:hypothetical protein